MISRFFILMVFCLISQVACVSTQANSASDEIVKLRHLVENLEKKVSKGLSNQPSVESVKEPGEDNKASKPTPYLIKFVNQFSTSLFKFVKDIESQVIKYATSLRNPEVRESVLKAIGTILGVVFSGLVGEGLFYLMMRPFESRLTRRVEEGHLTKREIFWIRGCLSVLPILIFVSFSALALIYFAPTPLTREIILLLMLAAALYKVGARTSNVLFNPKNPPLRVLSLANSVAKQADQQFRYLFLVVLGIGALIDSMLVLETNAAMMTFVVKFCLFFLYIASVRFVLRSRHYALNWVEKHVARFGKAEHWSEVLIRHFWHRWHIIASGYLTLLAVAFLLSPLSEYRTLLWDFIEMTTIMTGMYLLIFFIPNWMDKVSSALIHSIPGLKSRKKFYSDFLSTVAIMLSLAVMLLFIGAIWDINFLQGLLDGEKTSLYIVTALSILLIIFLGVLFWETIEYLMIGVFEPFLKKRSNAEDKQRIATLVPIIRIILKTLTVVVVTMMIFSELDFNITPIIAVFASLGIAVGLGGQKLAQDLITGTFILAENTLSIGDIVEINGHIGKVEKTTLRTVNLRDARGYFHSIPYSAITVITNTSKEYSRCLFDILIAYEYDYDDMCQILREADAEVRKDPNFGVFIDGELLFDGIQKLDSQGYLIRASILVAPGKQLALQREYNRVIKKYFDKHSIQHPYDRQNIVISNLADIGPILEGESYLKTPTPSS